MYIGTLANYKNFLCNRFLVSYRQWWYSDWIKQKTASYKHHNVKKYKYNEDNFNNDECYNTNYNRDDDNNCDNDDNDNIVDHTVALFGGPSLSLATMLLTVYLSFVVCLLFCDLGLRIYLLGKHF